MLNLRVSRGHDIERLDDVRAVLTGLREIGLEPERPLEPLDRLERLIVDTRRMPARMKEGQNKRGEFMPERELCELNARRAFCVFSRDREARAALGLTIVIDSDELRRRGKLPEEGAHLPRRLALIERGDEAKRLLQIFEIDFELCFEFVIEHDSSRV